ETVTSMSSKHRVGLVVVSVALALTPGAAGATGGTALAWGCGGGNDFGQCTVPSGLSSVTAIAAGLSHSLALKSDGTVVDWGCKSVSGGAPAQCLVPAGLTGGPAIAAAPAHSLAPSAAVTAEAGGAPGRGGSTEPG